MLNRIKANIKNVPGWRTNRKLVVIESDDWGATRIPSLDARLRAQAGGAKFGLGMGFDDFDTLENAEDLCLLFEVLSKHKDCRGNNAVITANSVVANPDFEKIKYSQYNEYHYKLITDTYSNKTFDLLKEGMKANIFHPQFHGREHLNVMRWLEALRNDNEGSRAAFAEGIWSNTCKEMLTGHCMAAYDYATEQEKDFVLHSIIEGLSLFEKIFGYSSYSTIAPCFIWSDEITGILVNHGVKCFQSGTHQKFPYLVKFETKNNQIFRYTGQRGNYGEYYLQRNCSFEPASELVYSPESSMRDIRRAFFWGKPAILQSHRINFVGGLDKKNRDRNLNFLDELLKRVTTEFPQVEFMTSDQLGKLIINGA